MFLIACSLSNFAISSRSFRSERLRSVTLSDKAVARVTTSVGLLLEDISLAMLLIALTDAFASLMARSPVMKDRRQFLPWTDCVEPRMMRDMCDV